MGVEQFEDQLRAAMRATADEVAPAPRLPERVVAARKAQVRRRRTARVAVVAGVGAVAAVAVAVVPSPVQDDAVGVAAAAEETRTTSFRFETVVDGAVDEVRAEGEVGAGGEEARLVTTTPLPTLLEGEPGGGGEVEVVLAERQLYVRVDDLGEAEILPPGTTWLGVDLAGGGFADRTAASLLEALGPVDPSRALDVLDDIAEEVVEDGSEDIDGTPTTRYRFRASLAGEDDVTGRAWVDEDGRLRRLELEGDGVTATTDLFDFGAEVDVEAPPAAEVATLDEVIDQGLGG